MLQVTELLSRSAAKSGKTNVNTSLTLPFELRQKSRLRTQLDNNIEIGLLLPRGTVLRQGDLLRADNGLVIEIKAADESVSTATSTDPLLLARACYHLGNRHMPLQIGNTWLRYLHDHVLDDMVKNLGLDVIAEHASFEPEAGAYTGANNIHAGHSHAHAH